MPQQWNIGDVVRLKSGGPNMTVIVASVHPNGRNIVSCQWYVESAAKFDTASFDVEALEARQEVTSRSATR
jgi:uncharacterized protein YodC (DUF2158 family)